ncbi:hypothetical protein E2C01_018791 [Portunus trituberculatus]|uniref:Uncharacterized protein n=1 Tax=Portunus trituberculatus TaxID=210409 RepID=A0A5B7DX57_PORTR|nr:hypothetical protein [Portunus trituberculatus]
MNTKVKDNLHWLTIGESSSGVHGAVIDHRQVTVPGTFLKHTLQLMNHIAHVSLTQETNPDKEQQMVGGIIPTSHLRHARVAEVLIAITTRDDQQLGRMYHYLVVWVVLALEGISGVAFETGRSRLRSELHTS